MSGEVINLRRARKARARLQHDAQARENRIRHGTTSAERETLARESARAAAALAGAKRDRPGE